MFYEIVVAPGYTPEGLEVLKVKSKALRILEAKPRAPSGRSLRQIAGGWLLQVGCNAMLTVNSVMSRA
jgi:phosphoribosylaminoimidazolecarboxamide formyltransferase/IMP cyclohydrolase